MSRLTEKSSEQICRYYSGTALAQIRLLVLQCLRVLQDLLLENTIKLIWAYAHYSEENK